MTLLAGRWFTEADRADAPRTAIISEAMARMYWPDRSPLGLRIERDDMFWEIVGIVGDVLRADLTGELEPTFYLSYYQESTNRVTFTLKSEIDTDPIVAPMRGAVWDVDPALPIARIETMESMIESSYAQERFRTLLVSIFGVAAALLSALGIFAVTVRGVAARTRELGIRRAIGAREVDLVGLVLRQQVVVLVAGMVLGLSGAAWLSAILSPFLFGVPTRDPITYVVAALGLGALGLLAAYLPARRAGRLDPNEVLQLE
jgi:putative ABC transport system permease protein